MGKTETGSLVQALLFASLVTVGVAGCASHADYVQLRKDMRAVVKTQRELQAQQEAFNKQIKALESGPLSRHEAELSQANREQINQLTLQLEKLQTRLAEARISPPIRPEGPMSTPPKAESAGAVEEPVESADVGTTSEADVPTSVASLGSMGPTAAFRAAYNDYLSGRFDLAITGFRRFLVDFPFTSLTPRVLYYLGETYSSTKEAEKAAQAFRRVVEEYPDSEKVPASIFKLGVLMAESKKPSEARAYFQRVIDQFPASDEAHLAEQHLSQLP